MRIDDYARFGHPVLRVDTDDFSQGELIFSVDVEERPVTGEMSLHCTFDLDQNYLKRLVEEGAAVSGIFVVCPETYLNSFFELTGRRSQIDLGVGRVLGTVRLRPVVISKMAIVNFDSPDLHPEFQGAGITVPAGAPLAIGPETRLNAGMEKLAPVESVFELAKNSRLPEGQIAVRLDNQVATIEASPELYESLSTYRQFEKTRAILLNSVYLPALMEILSVVSGGAGEYEDLRWYRVFRAKCEHLGVDPESIEILESAQKLLQLPLRELGGLKEELTA